MKRRTGRCSVCHKRLGITADDNLHRHMEIVRRDRPYEHNHLCRGSYLSAEKGSTR